MCNNNFLSHFSPVNKGGRGGFGAGKKVYVEPHRLEGKKKQVLYMKSNKPYITYPFKVLTYFDGKS